MKTPLISVLMASYNAENYITEAIESIFNQTLKNFEFIIIDDASTDKTWEIIQKYAKKDKRIRPYRNKTNLKLSNTLNKGIMKARGKYIARMDADDWSYPYRLELQYEFMEKNPDFGISGGAMEICDEYLVKTAKRKYELFDRSIRNKFFLFSPFSHPLIIIRRSILKKSDLYNPKYNPAEDYELYFRMGLYSKFANLNEILLKYRVLQNSMTSASTKEMEIKTIRARFKFIRNKKYKIGIWGIIFTVLQYVSIFLIPVKLKLKLFYFIRNTR